MKRKKTTRRGKMDFSQPFPKSRKILFFVGLICLVLSFVLSAMSLNKESTETTDVLIGILGIVGFAVPIWSAISFVVWKIGNFSHNIKTKIDEREADAKAAEKARFEKEHPHYEEEKFYLLCAEQNIEDADTPAAVARICLVARKNNIKGTERELVAAFNTGKADVQQQKRNKKLAADRNEEMLLEAHNQKYMNVQAQEKRPLMCRDKACKYRVEEENYWAQSRSKRDAIIQGYSGAIRKEKDWATHGGIASGIAGPAAGIAVAADIQQKNAEIRKQNAEVMHLTAQVAINATRETDHLACEAGRKAEHWEGLAKEAENKLVEVLPADRLFAMLSPEGSASTSKTGAILVKVRIAASKNLKIYETVPAVVDGILAARIMVGTEEVGTAYLALPWNGAAGSTTLKGVCRNPIKTADHYSVVVSPYRLWGAEQ